MKNLIANNIKSALLMIGIATSVMTGGNEFPMKTDAEYHNLVVISNNAPNSELTQKEFEKIILGEKQRWEDGVKIKIALLKTTNDIGSQIADEVFDMSPNEFNRYWLGLVFEGKCDPPTFFATERELVEFINITPGSVGMVSTKTEIENVAKIKISS